ncbi:MAG: response regulator transcription factor [Microthrixaceae bacterium]
MNGPGDATEPLTVLVVEDDPSVAEVLTTALGARGYTVVVTRTGTAAVRAAAAGGVDLVLLDLGLPDMDGLEVCRRLRAGHGPLPVLVLTADGDEARKVAALDLGADDYVTKPFSMPELMARLRVAERHLRATGRTGPDDGGTGGGGGAVSTAGPLQLDRSGHTVHLDGRPVLLTRKEFRLLDLLVREPGALVEHARLVEHVWEGGAGSNGSLRVHAANLRRKLAEAAAGGDPGVEVRSEPGTGYRLVIATP